MTQAEESKTAKHERIKGERNPWEMLPDILEYARQGFGAFPEEEFNVRLRWWGLYPQGDGTGTKGRTDPYFMLRLRIPGGKLSAGQFRLIGRLSAKYARGTADITVRQNIQFHWIPAEALPDIFDQLASEGITSMGACGDDTRNITTCPLSGIDSHPRNDLSDLVAEATRALNGNPVFYNLPRKFKITLCGCESECTYPEINDVGITPVRHEDGREGFSVQVGGGLSTRPHFAVRLHFFLMREQIVPLLVGIASLFRDQDVLRQKRERARLKFLFLEHGWDRERFEKELSRYIDFLPEPWVPVEHHRPSQTIRDHTGFQRQKDAGKWSLGIPLNQGGLTPDLIDKIAWLSETYGEREIRLTPQQNVLIAGISENARDAVASHLGEWGLPLDGSRFLSRTVSCTGKSFCRLALVETKDWSKRLAEELDRLYPHPGKPLNIHVTGCPNDCGQQRIAEIGLQGVQFKGKDGVLQDGFDLFLGGETGSRKFFNARAGIRISQEQAIPLLSRLVGLYEDSSDPEESFHDFVFREGFETIRELLKEEIAASGQD